MRTWTEFNLFWDRVQWWAFVNKFMKIEIVWKWGTSWAAKRLSIFQAAWSKFVGLLEFL